MLEYKDDFEDFIKSNNNIVFRVWRKDSLDEECEFYYIRYAISLGYDYIVCLEDCDGSDNDLVYITFELLSNIHFDYANTDQNE